MGATCDGSSTSSISSAAISVASGCSVVSESAVTKASTGRGIARGARGLTAALTDSRGGGMVFGATLGTTPLGRGGGGGRVTPLGRAGTGGGLVRALRGGVLAARRGGGGRSGPGVLDGRGTDCMRTPEGGASESVRGSGAFNAVAGSIKCTWDAKSAPRAPAQVPPISVSCRRNFPSGPYNGCSRRTH